jgi:hypothetical protein
MTVTRPLLLMNDKILHSLACASITCFTFVVSLAVLKIYSAVHSSSRHDDAICQNDVDEEDVKEVAQQQKVDGDVETASSPTPLTTHDNEVKRTNNVQPKFPKHILIMAGISGIVAMGVGITKEILDANELLWNGGTSSWGDILADFIGVVVGEIVIFAAVTGRSLFCSLQS